MIAAAMVALLASAPPGPPIDPAIQSEAATIDLNSASLDALESLPGIGRKKAEAIVALRTRRPFTRITQLLEVRGIGKKTLARLIPHVNVGSDQPTSQAPMQRKATNPLEH